MQKSLLAALAASAIALPVTPVSAQAGADPTVAAGASVRFAQRGDHRRFHRDTRRAHREFHRDTRRAHREFHRDLGPRRDWDRGEFRDHRRFHREAFRDHRRFHRDGFGRFDRRFGGHGFGFGHGFGSGFGFGHGFGFGSGFGSSHRCRALFWDGWAWRCVR